MAYTEMESGNKTLATISESTQASHDAFAVGPTSIASLETSY
jgi:hypothetical protein